MALMLWCALLHLFFLWKGMWENGSQQAKYWGGGGADRRCTWMPSDLYKKGSWKGLPDLLCKCDMLSLTLYNWISTRMPLCACTCSQGHLFSLMFVDSLAFVYVVQTWTVLLVDLPADLARQDNRFSIRPLPVPMHAGHWQPKWASKTNSGDYTQVLYWYQSLIGNFQLHLTLLAYCQNCSHSSSGE